MVTRLKVATFALALALSIAARASAQPNRPAVELVGDGGSLDAAKLADLVALELGASRVTRVTVDVRGARAAVEVFLGDEPRSAVVTLAAAEPERALALFVAELARGARSPAATPAPVTLAPPPPSPSPPAADRSSLPSPVRAPSRAWRLFALGTMGARMMSADGALLATPRLEIGARQRDGLRIGAVARYGYASAHDPLGAVRAHALAGGPSGTYVFLSGPSIALATGPRFEVGFVAGRGEGSNGASSTALTLGGSWELELHVNAGGLWCVGAIELGTLLRGIELRADDRDVLHLAGPFVGLALGAML